MRNKLTSCLMVILYIMACNPSYATTNFVPIYQGASALLEQRTCKVSEAVNSTTKLNGIIEAVQKACTNKEGIPQLRLEPNGRYYQCNNPVQSSVSLYVAHYEPFLQKIQKDGLKSFGFLEELANEKLCPFVSFSKSINTAVKYSFGVTDTNWDDFNGELPYYENSVPSFSNIGSIMIALTSKNVMEQQINMLHIDVENEPSLILGKTKARRLGQKEICVIGGIPQNIGTLDIPVIMPSFSGEWQYHGRDDQQRFVNQFGFTKREYKARKRIVENADDTPKSWRNIYEKGCKWQEKSMAYSVNCAITDYFQNENYTIEKAFRYKSIFDLYK